MNNYETESYGCRLVVVPSSMWQSCVLIYRKTIYKRTSIPSKIFIYIYIYINKDK